MDEEKVVISEEKVKLTDRVKTINPRQLLIPVIILIVFIGTIIGIINYQQKTRQNRNPKIEITAPKDNQIIEESQIVLEGNTYAGTKVTVNGKDVSVDKKGKFSTEVSLNEGLNEITITAESQTGKKTEVKKAITREYTQPVVAEMTPSGVEGSQNAALNSSGPENFWIPEALSFSGVGAAWYMSRKNLKKALKK
jgi:cell division protein FtsL